MTTGTLHGRQRSLSIRITPAAVLSLAPLGHDHGDVARRGNTVCQLRRHSGSCVQHLLHLVHDHGDACKAWQRCLSDRTSLWQPRSNLLCLVHDHETHARRGRIVSIRSSLRQPCLGPRSRRRSTARRRCLSIRRHSGIPLQHLLRLVHDHGDACMRGSCRQIDATLAAVFSSCSTWSTSMGAPARRD